jgi:hypothetical protein
MGNQNIRQLKLVNAIKVGEHVKYHKFMSLPLPTIIGYQLSLPSIVTICDSFLPTYHYPP